MDYSNLLCHLRGDEDMFTKGGAVNTNPAFVHNVSLMGDLSGKGKTESGTNDGTGTGTETLAAGSVDIKHQSSQGDTVYRPRKYKLHAEMVWKRNFIKVSVANVCAIRVVLTNYTISNFEELNSLIEAGKLGYVLLYCTV